MSISKKIAQQFVQTKTADLKPVPGGVRLIQKTGPTKFKFLAPKFGEFELKFEHKRKIGHNGTEEIQGYMHFASPKIVYLKQEYIIGASLHNNSNLRPTYWSTDLYVYQMEGGDQRRLWKYPKGLDNLVESLAVESIKDMVSDLLIDSDTQNIIKQIESLEEKIVELRADADAKEKEVAALKKQLENRPR